MKPRNDAIDEHGKPTRLIAALDGGNTFVVKPSPIHGHGTFAARNFKAGEPVGHAATTRSLDQVTPEDHVAIDRTVLGRYINHARQPNTRLTELKPGLLHMVATSPITTGQELTCHYVDALQEQQKSYQKKNAQGGGMTEKQAMPGLLSGLGSRLGAAWKWLNENPYEIKPNVATLRRREDYAPLTFGPKDSHTHSDYLGPGGSPRALDVHQLLRRTQKREPTLVSLTDLLADKQVNRSSNTGFSKKRYAKVDTSYPILLDRNQLIDGRHRVAKMLDEGMDWGWGHRLRKSDLAAADITARFREMARQHMAAMAAKQAAAYPEEQRLGRAIQRVDPEPTVAQREAGNHRMGHVRMHGLNITVEVADGQTRTGVGKDGKVWKKPMKCHYGYIKRTKGADGDHVDVYVGPHPQSEVVFVVDQVHSDGTFDEHKSMLGFTNQEDAKDMYLAHIPADRLGGITPMTMKDFKHWAFKSVTRRPLKKASLLACEEPLGEEYISTFPKLAALEALDDTSASLMGPESMGYAAPQGITFEDEPMAGEIQPLLGAQPAEPLPAIPLQPVKPPGTPPSPPQLAAPPPVAPAPQPAQPGQPAQPVQPAPQLPQPPTMPALKPPTMPALKPPTMPALKPPAMPTKLAQAARGGFVGPRGPVFLPGEDSPLSDPKFLLPAATTTAGIALGGPDWEDRLTGGLKGLATGAGAVGGGMLGHRLGGTGGALAGGAGAGLLSLLLARKLLDKKKPEFNVVRFRKKRTAS